LLPTSVPVAIVSSGRENVFNQVINYNGVILLTITKFQTDDKKHEIRKKSMKIHVTQSMPPYKRGCTSRFTPTTFEDTRQHILLTHGTSWGSYYRHVYKSGSITSNL
jgi:hypothetical protein